MERIDRPQADERRQPHHREARPGRGARQAGEGAGGQIRRSQCCRGRHVPHPRIRPRRAGQVQGRAFDARLRELANTVCPKDLRTYEQRRADGLSALVDGAGYVKCECGQSDCGQDSRIVSTACKPLVHLIRLGSTLAGSDEPAYLDGYGIVDAAHAREIEADADVEPVRPPSVAGATTYRPGTVLDTWLRVLAGGCEVALRCRGLEHGPRSSSAVRSLRSHRRRSDGGRKPDRLLPKSSPAQTFRTLAGGRRGRNRVDSTHRAPIPTAVVGPSRWRTRRCRWRWPPRRRRSPPHPRAAQGCPDPGRAPSPAGPPGCGAAPVARRAST
ncbi:hypothetical protein ROP_50700 [Rhodococcus opacus B4]|uniref:DUF222 domain-containing protein n=1 Tax=Rhodococcus opacus (strain B4) TaxID=632772 RepID=C1ATQ3_RHOOB|nr:hypothetical protein ROP_50700 [Rhodococcus opacus B4]